MIKFSIITVSLNAGDDLIDTVESIISQDYENYEIIIKDGFSTDGSIEKLPNNEKIRLIQKRDSGIYDAMNQAIDEATGDYLLFINAGDKLANTSTLATISCLIEKDNHKHKFYYGYSYNEMIKVYDNAPKSLTPFFCFRTMLCHQAMIFHKSIFSDKRYDCDFKIMADKELLLHVVVEKNYKTMYLPILIAKYKAGGFCEQQGKSYIKYENTKLQEKYFTKNQTIRYKFLINLTFPRVRKIITNNPKLIKSYRRIIGVIYGNKRKV